MTTKCTRHPRRPGAVDRHVGIRLRKLRERKGWNQMQAGEVIGVTFQQIQKYEKGINRISAGHLYQMSLAADVPVNYFFRDL